jgi:hypothetical protein
MNFENNHKVLENYQVQILFTVNRVSEEELFGIFEQGSLCQEEQVDRLWREEWRISGRVVGRGSKQLRALCARVLPLWDLMFLFCCCLRTVF